MKKLLKINKIFILLVLYLCCSTVNLYAQNPKIMHVSLKFKDVASFTASDIGVKGDGTGKEITVEVYSYASYKATDTKDSGSFLFGFKSANTSNTDYVNTSLGNVIKANDNPYSEDMFTTSTFRSNDLRYFKSQTEKAATEQGYYFNSLIDGLNDLVVKVKVAGTATDVSAVTAIKLPGVILKPNDDIAGTIKVYRGDSTTPIRTLEVSSNDVDNTFDLVVYQGDKVDFIAKSGSSPSVGGLMDTNVMRWAGEVLYTDTRNFKQGDIKPFLFFDSNVHGVKLRRYPDNMSGTKKNYPVFEASSTATNADLKLTWLASGRSEHAAIMTTNEDSYQIKNYLKNFKEKAGGFPNNNKFFAPNEPNLDYQRNNQKEGLNMELLRAHLSGSTFVAGLDPDELIYKNLSSSLIVGNSDAAGKNFNYVSNDQWKVIGSGERTSITSPLHMFLNQIGKYVGGKDNYKCHIHEIVDNNLYVNRTTKITIEGKEFDNNVAQPMFNNKKPVYYSPLIGNKPIILNQVLRFDTGGRNFKINLAVLSPLEGKRKNKAYNALTVADRQNPEVNFYGIIEGPIFVSRYQQGVQYTVQNLPNTADVPGTFSLLYTYEDSYGILTTVRKEVSGETKSATFNIQGGGYHDITLQYKRSKDASNNDYVIIAGKELIDVDLRFIFSPNAVDGSDFSYNGTQTFGSNADPTKVTGNIRLNENKANGKYWFLDNNNAKLKASGYGNTHGYKDHNAVRTYTIDRDETIALTVLDADPHSFVHYQPDFYLSERRLSKRATDADLANSAGNSKIEWFIAKDAAFTIGKTSKGYGRYLKITPSVFYPKPMTSAPYKGPFYVKAIFNGTEASAIVVKIVQKDIGGFVGELEGGADLGAIGRYNLSDDQWSLLKTIAPNTYTATSNKDNFRIFKIQDILSSYAYGEKDCNDNGRAPRYGTVGEHTRFSDMNNYDARFTWYFSNPINGANIPRGDILHNFKDNTDADAKYITNYQNTWFPKYWVRHLDSTPISPEIPNPDSRITKFNEAGTSPLTDYNGNVEPYEKWQMRLPWIAQSGLQGYKTRWNIKCIYDVERIFNKSEVGNAWGVSSDAATYSSKVIGNGGDKVIANFTDIRREYQEFYYMLKNQEIVIVDMTKLNNKTVGSSEVGIEVYDNENRLFFGNVSKNVSVASTAAKLAQGAIDESLPLSSKEQLCRVYPNPNNLGIFTIDIKVTQVNSTVNLQLADLAGRVIFTDVPKTVNGNYSTTIGDNLQLPKGTYLLTIKINDTVETKKLIVN